MSTITSSHFVIKLGSIVLSFVGLFRFKKKKFV